MYGNPPVPSPAPVDVSRLGDRLLTIAPRMESVDLLRGVVIMLMALDHVRDFLSNRLYMDVTDLDKTSPGLFLTRWVTHFCAPTFIFLAGVGAFLSRTRGKSQAELAWFLLTRGLWLVFLELTVIRASWWFNWDPLQHGPGVFWAIGWSMIVLAPLVFLPVSAVATFGVVMIAGHNLLDSLTHDQLGVPAWIWTVLHKPGNEPVCTVPAWIWTLLHKAGDESAPGIITLGTGYCLVPWIGVMAAGYSFGSLLLLERPVRRRELLGLGAALTVTFVLLRAVNLYGDPHPWSAQERGPEFTVFSFLNCTKYPASLLYLLMTLGPAIFALGLFDRPLGSLARPIITFGRVPLFFYLLHIPLIHGLAVLCDYLRFGWSPQASDGPWAVQPDLVPSDYGISLPMVYLVWVGVLLVLYLPCKWFAEVKRRRRDAWLSYL
jgi:uncharacterized membrane protein